MFALERLINATEIIRLAGFDPYRYRGRHGQSIEMAISYYACFARGAGFYKAVTRDNSGSCRCPSVLISAHGGTTRRHGRRLLAMRLIERVAWSNSWAGRVKLVPV
jgi:broad specificity phosphatase PhoE